VAPRDFIDNTLASPASTETFRYAERLHNLSELEMSARNSIWEKVEYLLAQASFIYQKRLDFVYLQHLVCKSILAQTLGLKDLEGVHAPFALRGAAMLQLPEDTGPNELCISPYDAKQAKYSDNLDQYRYRYLPFRPKPYKAQVSYLGKLLCYAQNEGINVVLVNMPITKDNMSIMPHGLYDMYMKDVTTLAHNYGARFVNMNDQNLFPKDNFEDSVHLNGLGGQRFFELLTDRMKADAQLAQTVTGQIN
jgi:hypothetical protein